MSLVKLLSIAEGEVGVHEGYSDGHWNNFQKYSPAVPGLEWSQWQAWCATFVSWLAMKADLTDKYPRTASCATGVSWFKNKGRFSAYPAVGAQCFFGSGGGSHTGVVYAYDADYIYTIEGNTNLDGSPEGDGVYKRKRERRAANTYGYGYPDVDGGSVSADPDAAKYGYRVKATGSVSDLGAPSPAPAPSKPTPPHAKPQVSVKHLNAARKADIPAATGHTTYKAEVLVVERALKAEGLLKAYVDGSWGTTTQAAYDAFRRKEGYTGEDAKGAVGLESLRKLAAKHGFNAVA